MTTRRVMPRAGIEATSWTAPSTGQVWWRIGRDTVCTDAEFASAFVDAELFDAVLTAALTLLEVEAAYDRGFAPDHPLEVARTGLLAALRAYDEGQAQ